MGFPGGSAVKNPPTMQETASIPGQKISWRRKWQPTLVFLPGKSHGQRSMASYTHGFQEVEHNLATKQQKSEL